MRALQSASIVMAMSIATGAVAGDFDGALPLTCTAEQVHDCLPSKPTCSRMKPESNIPPVFGVDFAKKEIRSPFRTALLPVVSTSTNKDSLVMQGTDLLMAWSALVDRKTGALTISVADSKGSYVAFGTCKVTEKK